MKKIDYFSSYCSYISFKNKDEHLVMHTKHGSSKTTHHNEVLSIDISKQQKVNIVFPVTEICSDMGNLKATFVNEKTVIIKTEGNRSGVSIDLKPRSKYDYIYEIRDNRKPTFVINSYSTLTKYLLYSADAQIEIEQNYDGDLYKFPEKLISRLIIQSVKDSFTFFIQEIKHNIERIKEPERPFEYYAEKTEESFQSFCRNIRIPYQEWKDDIEYAAYILFSSTVGESGIQKRELVVASNEMMNCVWAFDSGFPAYALAKTHVDLALNQVLAFYDFQDEQGCIPGSMDDANLRWSFLKPPGQGMFLKRILAANKMSKEDMLYAYEGLKKQVGFWLYEKDMNKDGICEYHHGNESCLDNSTIFDEGYPVDSPDLSAYMIENMDCLAQLAEKLGYKAESKEWIKAGDLLAEKALVYFVEDDIPYARKTLTGEKICSDSIMPYTLLLLRHRLPERLRKKWCTILENEFLTDYGLASEKTSSSKFEENGYFRGSIFHYYSIPLADALADVGEYDLAKKIAEGYCRSFIKSGSSECFNALNGDGQHVVSFTSSAGTFIYFCEKYIYSK